MAVYNVRQGTLKRTLPNIGYPEALKFLLTLLDFPH